MTTRLISITTEPVTLAETKLACRITVSEDDALVTRLITAARGAAEQITGRSLATCIRETWLDAFPDEIQLLWPPNLTVSEVTYVDTAGATQTLDPSAYSLDSKSEPGWLLPAVDTEWPETQEVANAVKVRFTAGYGTDCPSEAKTWIIAQVRHWYDNPGALIANGAGAARNPYLDALLDSCKVYG